MPASFSVELAGSCFTPPPLLVSLEFTETHTHRHTRPSGHWYHVWSIKVTKLVDQVIWALLMPFLQGNICFAGATNTLKCSLNGQYAVFKHPQVLPVATALAE